MTGAASASKRWIRRPDGSNWGDFGPDDQIGRMNLITPEMRLAALREVKEGRTFVLSLPLDHPGGEPAGSARLGPKLFASRSRGRPMFNLALNATDLTCDDGVTMSLQYSTQWDSLAHWGRMFDVDGGGVLQPVYYNGFRAHIDIVGPDADSPPHADRLGIENLAMTGVQGRGVLVDLVRSFGAGRTLIGHAELMRAIDEQQVEVRPGDFLLLYTGYGDAILSMAKRPDPAVLRRTGAAVQGADDRLAKWVADSGVVAIISDNEAVETYELAQETEDRPGMLPFHDLCLFRLGVHLGELWWLGDLAHHLREAGRHAFLLTAPPLRLPGAVGSPVTPVATV